MSARAPFNWTQGPGRKMLTRVAASVLLIGLTAVAFYLFLYADLVDRLDKQRREEMSLATQVADMKRVLEAYQFDLAELATLQKQQRELNSVLPETTEYPAFLSAVQGVANVSGVELQGWTPQDEIVQKYFAKVPMKLVLTGRYHQIAKFFYGVGQLDRIINVENIALTPAKASADEPVLRVECLATSFHSIPARTATPAAGSAPGAKP